MRFSLKMCEGKIIIKIRKNGKYKGYLGKSSFIIQKLEKNGVTHGFIIPKSMVDKNIIEKLNETSST